MINTLAAKYELNELSAAAVLTYSVYQFLDNEELDQLCDCFLLLDIVSS